MPSISPNRQLLTVVNVFTVDPADADRLISVAVETAQRVTRSLPGFVSSSFHKSTDGGRVVNYAQWERAEAVRAGLDHPDVEGMLHELADLAQAAPGTYRVVAVVERD